MQQSFDFAQQEEENVSSIGFVFKSAVLRRLPRRSLNSPAMSYYDSFSDK
jgi:hypothetical protein